jgi:hypothetical protein
MTEGGLPPLLLGAGRQYLALRGRFDADALRFLAHVLDDLHARRAVLGAAAGSRRELQPKGSGTQPSGVLVHCGRQYAAEA